MKKILLLIYLILLYPLLVLATDYNTIVGNDIGYNGCLEFQDSRINATTNGYFGHCKKAFCYTGEWETSYYISSDMITCSNGNRNYYVQYINDGCSQYKGVCTPTTDVKYCSLVTYYDCTKTRSGEVYIPTGQPVLDSNNYLKSLKLSNGSINFNKTVLNYQIEVPSSLKSITVEAYAESNKATITILNTENIGENNPIKIEVKAENGSVRTYTISIKFKTSSTSTTTKKTTKPVLDSNNYLKSLTVPNISLDFNRNTLNYYIEVSKDIKTITVNAIPESNKATVTISNNEIINENIPIKIEVKAENGKIRTYTISIKYKTEIILDSNNYLKNLTLSNIDLKFNKETLVYNIEIDENVKNIDVNALAESEKAKIVIENNKNINENIPIKITVTAENGTARIYTINIKYKKETPSLSSNNYLKSLEIKNYKLDFKKDKNNYTLKIDKDVETLEITALTEDEKSNYSITGNEKLKNKSKIKINVSAENGEINTYIITIKKSSNILLQLLIILIAIVVVIFIYNLLNRILPGRKDKKYDYE